MLPHPDPASMLTAVISAALFTLAIVYLVRFRQGRSDLESTLGAALATDLRAKQSELFSTVIIERRVPGIGLTVSVGFHVWVLLAGPALPYLFPAKLAVNLQKYNVKIVEFRLPAPLLYTSPGQQPPAQPRAPVRIERSLAAAERAQASARRGADNMRNVLGRARFELPASQTARTRDVVIQPDRPREAPVVLHHKLPSAFLWAQRPAPPDESRLVGAREPQKPLLRFTLPQTIPQLQRPNLEVAIANLQIASGRVLTFRSPLLPVPPANVSPVRVPAPSMEPSGELPASALPSGVPMNLIALLETLAPLASGYLIEAGNRLAESRPEGAAGTAVGSGVAGAGSTPGASAPGGANTGASRGTFADLLAAASGRPGGSGEASKQVENPSTHPLVGNLGVIVVQQNSQDSILEGGETLSGQPVYTVFFDVPGAPRRWILQYCVPGTAPESVERSETVVRIRPRKTVQPPYPLERIPVDLTSFQGRSKRLVLYARVNERGEPEGVRLIRGTGQEVDQVALATLARWTFRPATNGDAPVAVEALFGIPLQ